MNNVELWFNRYPGGTLLIGPDVLDGWFVVEDDDERWLVSPIPRPGATSYPYLSPLKHTGLDCVLKGSHQFDYPEDSASLSEPPPEHVLTLLRKLFLLL